MESSRRDLLNDMAENGSTLKNTVTLTLNTLVCFLDLKQEETFAGVLFSL